MNPALSKFTFALALLIALPAMGAEYTIDKDHSHVGFTIRHLASKVKGQFTEFEGTFTFDEKKVEDSKLNVTIQTASIDTGNKKRDDHLRNPDFFDAASEANKTITFTSKKVSAMKDKKFKVEGDLKMHGKTNPVTLEVEFGGISKDPWGNTRAGFSATTGKKPLNRKDYGIIWNKALDQGGVMLGDDVALSIEIEAIQKKSEEKKN